MKRLLIILGSPLWLPLILAAAVVVLSLLLVLWVVSASVLVSGVALSLWGIFMSIFESVYTGIAAIGAGVFSVGISACFFVGAYSATSLTARLLKSGASHSKKEL